MDKHEVIITEEKEEEEQTRAPETALPEIANSGEKEGDEERDTRHTTATTTTKNSDLPTDAMVTVRLSDASITPAVTDIESDEDTETILAENDSISENEHNIPSIITDGLPTEDSTAPADEAHVTDMHHRDSLASLQSFREDASSTTLRSRSDSSGTLSSNNSAQVDWVELEKSEEQAERDEGSDEVRPYHLCRIGMILTVNIVVNSLLAG